MNNIELLQSLDLDINRLVLNDLEHFNSGLSILAGVGSEFPEKFTTKFNEISMQVYVKCGFTKPEISLQEWADTPQKTEEHYIMLIDQQKEILGGVKLIQDISFENSQQELSTNIKTFPVHNEVTGYDYYGKIPFHINNNEVVEIGRLFINNSHKKGNVSPAEEVIIGLCFYIKKTMPQIRGAIGVIEKNLALKLIQNMEHISQNQTSAIYTFPDFYPTKEILESNHSPYFRSDIGIPFFIDTNSYIDRILSYYQK